MVVAVRFSRTATRGASMGNPRLWHGPSGRPTGGNNQAAVDNKASLSNSHKINSKRLSVGFAFIFVNVMTLNYETIVSCTTLLCSGYWERALCGDHGLIFRLSWNHIFIALSMINYSVLWPQNRKNNCRIAANTKAGLWFCVCTEKRAKQV